MLRAEACLVTAEEHRRLTAVTDAEGWERYNRAGVVVYDMAENPPRRVENMVEYLQRMARWNDAEFVVQPE